MKIDPLTKVTLSVTSRLEETSTAAKSNPQPITFIYGIGLHGLTDFECVLTGRPDENEIQLCLKPGDYQAFFGHLAPLFEPFMKKGDEIHFHFALVSAEPADSTEVVKAMASNQRCGCDCGCH